MKRQLFNVTFTTSVDGHDYELEIDVLGEGNSTADCREDAKAQVMELIGNEYSRDKTDLRDLSAQAVKQFYKRFVKSLNAGEFAILGAEEI